MRPEGFEPPTLCLEGRCSIHLSYGREVGVIDLAENFPNNRAMEIRPQMEELSIVPMFNSPLLQIFALQKSRGARI